MEQKIQMIVRSVSETEKEILRTAEFNHNEIVQRDGILYLRTGDQVFSCADIPEARLLLEAVSQGVRTEAEPDSEKQAWRDLLRGRTDLSLLQRYGIQEHARRCVILFRPVSGSAGPIRYEMIPVEDEDRIIALDNGEAALILNMKKRSSEEVFEYAAAVAETMESEAGISCFAGIGRMAETTGNLSDSCRDARNAMEIGIRYKIPGRVFAWDRQMLERLTDLIPSDRAGEFYREVISPQAEKVLNDEILETVRVFFQNDLNLSTTARQLFIHRNTLLYRMEKVRKVTGLDPRKFEDAVVFRIMMNISTDKE